MIFVSHVQFEIFYYNSKHNIYDFNYLTIKKEKKCHICDFRLRLYISTLIKKTGFDSKNNYKSGKLAYFRLTNS